ncbi:Asp-tRNA(Asn)/Glu-tRNA(Gln) amidotransferase subunit GatC [Nocardia cyriacigeorgica]|uniref:Aspartyl/glutamyl-tRNA(Asn/Gln) amidotransferase subunit C n=1 Tax=Nocardia cyriacigeorgica TaxID=135487 RepID=A0A6P1DDD5_9NOCA|nr:Asp-tRNA(Asn)/Glu-tRNA(Gln) amidotransferase subunit GatC [Nocardia cyriacigeorgica]NEW41249.1 Asp-tRNA(Asn)/Glu-tRNA(Gln) amidotransferase subunit GatC [Nocardia cyriacigeorgica]NEW46623.1 Asp-tRNA(Asn)/Glu-tRNA(Gln) amidotransferase subunit GatC [Nocardia cyriacigeorgica]NEW52152.1 Asp-tRNA(Asn)/Glu-tRNA(Gln) amidotransferase subunit GatC [Nocardia cyriacigeorgica]NEW57002.1 Asp-tRNA(Asn)/Glu-tRNA(Gln) amidotransferase subunit GatC [Nocardia cyriacigeorgica]
MPAISRDEVAHLARLSRLALTEGELDQFAGQLDSILSHVRTISEVAAADVPATASPNPATNVTRPDVVVPGLTPGEALSGAPAEEEQRFMVPQILGEAE